MTTSRTNNVPYHGPIPDRIRDQIDAAEKIIRDGGRVYFKFTCAKCGERQTFPDSNGFYITGRCEECGHMTDVLTVDADCGFDAVIPSCPEADALLEAAELALIQAPAWIARRIWDDEARESAIFQALRALAPHLNARGRRILYGSSAMPHDPDKVTR